jgi:hypothetical protein
MCLKGIPLKKRFHYWMQLTDFENLWLAPTVKKLIGFLKIHFEESGVKIILTDLMSERLSL